MLETSWRPTTPKQDLMRVIGSIPAAHLHDDLPLVAIAFAGWHCLMRLGELVDPDATDLCDYRKTIRRRSVC